MQIARSDLRICTQCGSPREIEALLRGRARQRPVVVLTGARQTGKTSLVRRLFPEHGFVSLDLPSEAEQAERDPRGFLLRHPPPLVVDEVQYAPGLFRHLKVLVDADRGATGQFILTGAQSFTLMRSITESLAGRADIQRGRHGGWTLHFWRDRSREADFLRHHGGRFDLADARWTATPDARDAAGLERIAAELPRGRVDRMAIVCRCENPYPLTERVQALPLAAVAALAGMA